jgi:hypothetical protein
LTLRIGAAISPGMRTFYVALALLAAGPAAADSSVGFRYWMRTELTGLQESVAQPACVKVAERFFRGGRQFRKAADRYDIRKAVIALEVKKDGSRRNGYNGTFTLTCDFRRRSDLFPEYREQIEGILRVPVEYEPREKSFHTVVPRIPSDHLLAGLLEEGSTIRIWMDIYHHRRGYVEIFQGQLWSVDGTVLSPRNEVCERWVAPANLD